MKLKLNKIVYFFELILCTCATLFEFIQYTILFKLIQYSILFKFIQAITFKRNVKKHPNLLQAISFNHLLCRLSELGCPLQPLGHLLLIEEQNNKSFRSSLAWNDCTPTPSNCFFLVNHHIRFCAMSKSILLSSSHTYFSTEHHLDSETY